MYIIIRNEVQRHLKIMEGQDNDWSNETFTIDFALFVVWMALPYMNKLNILCMYTYMHRMFSLFYTCVHVHIHVHMCSSAETIHVVSEAHATSWRKQAQLAKKRLAANKTFSRTCRATAATTLLPTLSPDPFSSTSSSTGKTVFQSIHTCTM